MLIAAKLLQFVNVRSSIVFNFLGRFIVFKQTHPKNAQLPIFLTFSPITTVSKYLQPSYLLLVDYQYYTL